MTLDSWLRGSPRRKNAARNLYRWLQPWREHPVRAAAAYWQLFRDWRRYRRLGGQAAMRDFYPCLYDRLSSTPVDPHYFYQAAWAMRHIAIARPEQHIDVGSDVRYIGMLSQVVPLTFVDIRPLQLKLPNLECQSGSVLALPYQDVSVTSLSCLHVVEHIGLGRYGDPLDPQGSIKAARELSRVLAPGGRLYVSVPVGRERVCYNAHRVFSPHGFVALFADLELREFSLVSDAGDLIMQADLDQAALADYACGLFVFEKPAASGILSS